MRWVNPRAISAGALISFACDVIAVAPGATLGAATPVQLGEGGEMKAVAEKVVSYMRKEMRATAEAKGRRGDIAEAMVDADAEVPGLDEQGKLLTLDGAQALAWGVAEVQAGSEALAPRAVLLGAPRREARRLGGDRALRRRRDPHRGGDLAPGHVVPDELDLSAAALGEAVRHERANRRFADVLTTLVPREIARLRAAADAGLGAREGSIGDHS